MWIGKAVKRVSASFPIAAALALQPPADARAADTKAQCVAAYDRAQALRLDAKLVAARRELLVCLQDACPSMIRKDCAQWLEEADVAIPTVVVSAHGADGSDLLDVRVSVDGEVVAERLDGRQLPLEPGDHILRFERFGTPPVEKRVLIREGEKRRLIDVTFSRAGADEAAASGSRPIPAATWLFGGLGLVALGGFTYFGLQGNSDVRGYQDCKPNCGDADVDATRTKYLVADVSLGVSLVSLGLATYYFAKRAEAPTSSAAAMRFEAGPTRHGFAAGLSHAF